MKEGFQPKWESLQQRDHFKLSDKNLSGEGKLHFPTTEENNKKNPLPARNSDSETRQEGKLLPPVYPAWSKPTHIGQRPGKSLRLN